MKFYKGNSDIRCHFINMTMYAKIAESNVFNYAAYLTTVPGLICERRAEQSGGVAVSLSGPTLIFIRYFWASFHKFGCCIFCSPSGYKGLAKPLQSRRNLTVTQFTRIKFSENSTVFVDRCVKSHMPSTIAVTTGCAHEAAYYVDPSQSRSFFTSKFIRIR